MLLIKLWNYLQGYVNIKILGEYGERFLNQAALNELYLWDIQRISKDVLTAKISTKDFVALRSLARKTQCRIIVTSREGIIFSLFKLRRRKWLIIGAIFFIIALNILAAFIWKIDINTTDLKLKKEILNDLTKWGLEKGTLKRKIDKQYYIDKILTKYKDIAWAEIQINGSKLTVDLVKKNLPPILEEDTPCDIIASKDGIIQEIIPLKGEPVVKPGDTVNTGDVLITGKVIINPEQTTETEDENALEENILLVPARGIVKARVWYQRAVKVPLVKEEKIFTGREKKYYDLQISNYVFKIKFGNMEFKEFEVETAVEKQLLPKFIGDVKFSVKKYKEVKTEKHFLGVDGAVKVAEKELSKQLKDLPKDVKTTQKNMDFVLDSEGNSVIGSLTLEVIEDIGKIRHIK